MNNRSYQHLKKQFYRLHVGLFRIMIIIKLEKWCSTSREKWLTELDSLVLLVFYLSFVRHKFRVVRHRCYLSVQVWRSFRMILYIPCYWKHGPCKHVKRLLLSMSCYYMCPCVWNEVIIECYISLKPYIKETKCAA